MKTQFLSAIAIATALALPAFATNAGEADKSGATPARPHSHVEDKTGIPQKPAAANPAKPNPAKNRAIHLHPRDGK